MQNLTRRPAGALPRLSLVSAQLTLCIDRLDSCADPLLFYTISNQSPESMAFVMLLEAAVNGYAASLGR